MSSPWNTGSALRLPPPSFPPFLGTSYISSANNILSHVHHSETNLAPHLSPTEPHSRMRLTKEKRKRNGILEQIMHPSQPRLCKMPPAGQMCLLTFPGSIAPHT